MKGREHGDGLGPADLDAEERWSRGSAVGEAAWIALCRATGADPKERGLDEAHGRMVDAVRGAWLALDTGGMDGLSDLLDGEQWLGMTSDAVIASEGGE